MAGKDDLIVGGYFFGSEEDAKEANRELKNARYLDERVNTMSVVQMKAVYNKMLDDKVFKTPVGWEYLKYLKDRMIAEGVKDEEIRPIPLYMTFMSQRDDNAYSHVAKLHVIPTKTELAKTKQQLQRTVIANIILILMVIAMFIITLTSSSPNIINYKTTITNQYAAWEQELTERENAVKEKEALYENIGG